MRNHRTVSYCWSLYSLLYWSDLETFSFDNTGGAQTNRFHVNANSQDVPFSKDGLLFELDGFKKQNGSEPEDPFFAEDRPTNGKRSSDHFEEEEDMDDEDDEDLGPETDVDAADEVLMSPSLAAARALLQAGVEGEGEEGGDQEPRQETPTPLAEAEGETGEPQSYFNYYYYWVDISCIVVGLTYLQQTQRQIVLVPNHSKVLPTLHLIIPFSSKREGKVLTAEHPQSHFWNSKTSFQTCIFFFVFHQQSFPSAQLQ